MRQLSVASINFLRKVVRQSRNCSDMYVDYIVVETFLFSRVQRFHLEPKESNHTSENSNVQTIM